MKALYSTLAGCAMILGLVFGIERYVTAQDSRTQLIVAGALQSFDKAQQIQYLLHLAETYRYRKDNAATATEREKWDRKLVEAEKRIDDLASKK